MNKIEKILYHYNKKSYIKQKIIKQDIKKINNILKPYKLNIKVKHILDYFLLQALNQSLITKLSIQQAYNLIYNDIKINYNDLTYDLKCTMIKNQINEIINSYPTFKDQGYDIGIIFFDHKLNNYYINQPAIFDTNIYKDLFDNFNKYLINNIYKLKPFYHNFIKEPLIYHTNHYYVFLLKEINQLVYIYDDYTIRYLPFSLSSNIDNIDLNIIQTYGNKEEIKFIKLLLETNLYDKKIKDKIMKVYKNDL